MGWLIVAATYAVIAAFYLRLAAARAPWWEAVRRSPPSRPRGIGAAARAFAGAAVDVVFLRRLLVVNPALWIGEWVFHASLFADHPAPSALFHEPGSRLGRVGADAGVDRRLSAAGGARCTSSPSGC